MEFASGLSATPASPIAALRASGANVKKDSGECGILSESVWAIETPLVKTNNEDKVTKKSLIDIGFAIGSAFNQLL